MRVTGKRMKMVAMAKNHAQAFEAMDLVVDGSRTGRTSRSGCRVWEYVFGVARTSKITSIGYEHVYIIRLDVPIGAVISLVGTGTGKQWREN